MLMEPWISLAGKNGCRSVCEGHYLGAENARDNMDEETFRAVIKAVDLINSDKKRFLHYLIEQPKFAAIADDWGGLTVDDFHLPPLRYTHPMPYTNEQVEDTCVA